MRDFNLHTNGYFDHRIKKVEFMSAIRPRSTEYKESMADQLTELREHQNLAGYFAVLMTFSAFEQFLEELYGDSIYLATVPDLRELIVQATRRRISLAEFRSFFKVLGIDLGGSSYDWSGLLRLQSYRNAIAHQRGWVGENNVKTLAPFGYKLGQYIEIPSEFVFEAASLVDKTTDQFSREFLTIMSGRPQKTASKKREP
jgi:hypothetical protein